MVLANHFKKFPNLRVASVENGAEFLPDLFRKLRSVDRKMRGWFPDDPVEIFRRHIWINPFWEDDLVSVVEWMGADRVLFGSDWPHIEALPQPLDYLTEAKALDAGARRKVLLDNVTELTDAAPRLSGPAPRGQAGCPSRSGGRWIRGRPPDPGSHLPGGPPARPKGSCEGDEVRPNPLPSTDGVHCTH